MITIPQETEWILFWIYSIICWITALILIIMLIKFIPLTNLVIIQKRFYKIIIIEAILAIIMCLTLLPIKQYNNSSFKTNEYFMYLENILFIILSHGYCNLEALRLWLMYYKLNFIKEMKHYNWESKIIDKNVEKKYWYINHQKTFGKIRWVIKIPIIYSIFSILTESLIRIFVGVNMWIIILTGMVYGLPLLLPLYLYWTSPFVYDKFWFYFEFRQTAYVFTIVFVVHFIGIAFYATVNPLITSCFTNYMAYMAYVFTIVISMYWVPFKIIKSDLWQQNSTLTQLTKDIHQANISQFQLSLIFTNDNALSMFATHLQQEFSIENMMGFIEMKQYQYHLHKLLYPNKPYKDGTKDFIINSFIPRSAIVFKKYKLGDKITNKDEILEEFRSAALKLYNKYIDTKSEFQLNIDYEQRETYRINIKHNVNKLNENDLCNLWQPVLFGELKLMREAWWRFKKSPTFQVLISKEHISVDVSD